jgi:perosamine synthetase
MPDSNKHVFCGPPGMGLSTLLTAGKSRHPVCSWFRDARVCYVHRARTAIAYLPELLRMDPGDEILMPAYNCGTEIDPLLKAGISIVLYRVDKSTRIDVADIRRRVTDRTKAVYVTHYFGFPQPLTELKQICQQGRMYLIEDCALSLFSSDGAARLGTVGDVSVMSFPKTLPVPDGGALVINNPALATDRWSLKVAPKSAVFRNFLPLLKSATLRSLSRRKWTYPLYELLAGLSLGTPSDGEPGGFEGWNKMPENYYYTSELADRAISALTRRALDGFDFEDILEKRRANYRGLLTLVSGNQKITPLLGELPAGTCPLCFPVIVDRRNQVCAELNNKRIDAIPWWGGYHRELSWDGFDDARFLKDNLLVVPVHQDLTENEVTFVAERLLAAA